MKIAELENSNSNSYNNNLKYDDITIALKDMIPRLDYLESLLCQESNKTRRDDMQRRVKHLKQSYEHVKQSLQNYLKRRNINYNVDYELNKVELFSGGTNSAHSTHVSPHNAFENAHLTSPYQPCNYPSQEQIDIENAENASLLRSRNMVNDYIQSGSETLSELSSQRSRLKGIHRKVYDMVNSLGISNSLLKLIENRDLNDARIVYGGMFVICCILGGLFWFVV